MVLAHAELAVAQFVEGHIHVGNLGGDDVITGHELGALEFERPHRFASGQDRKALGLDEFARFVEQGVQDAGLDPVGVFLDVDQRGVAAREIVVVGR